MRKGQKLTPEQRAKKVKVLAALKLNGGNVSKTSRDTKTPRSTIIKWRDQNTEAAKALKAKKLAEKDAKEKARREAEQTAIAEETDEVVRLSLSKMDDLAADLLQSIHNDIKQEGPMRRFPLRDKAWTFGVLFDKMQLSKGEATSIINQIGSLSTEERSEGVQRLLGKARQRRLNATGKEMGILDGGKEQPTGKDKKAKSA